VTDQGVRTRVLILAAVLAVAFGGLAGRLAWLMVVKRGELAQEIEAQILALEPGEVSKPYRSALGWHIFRLESKDSLEGAGLDRAKAQIRDILLREKYEARLEAWLREIKGRAVIEVRLDQP